MSVETGYIEYIFDVRGANAVRREFDSVADAANAGEVSFSQLEKIIAAVEGRAPRLAASLRKTRLELEASAKATREQAAAEKMRPALDKAKGESDAAQRARGERAVADHIGKAADAQKRLNAALKEEVQARREIRSLASGGSSPENIQRLTSAHQRLTGAIRSGETAQRDLTMATQSLDRGIISQRYAMYDIANVYGVVGTAMAGMGVYATVVGAQFQTAFTNVERTLDPMETTAASVNAIRQSLIQLQGQIPLTFAELSQIATIGNQMGIAEEDLIDFTSTIARFASVSGVSIEETSKAFGGFMAQTGLAPQYLENLGSSLALVSLKSNATEAEILSTSRQIAALSANAGMSADQIVGLASTFAALRIAPEAARGALGMYFGKLRTAVAEGGTDLQNFATVVGVTSDELDRMVQSGEGAKVLEGFLSNLNKESAVGVTQALNELGLSQLRVDNAFVSLSNRLGIFKDQMSLAQRGFIEGAELNRQYAMTVDDLASQWTILINGLNSIIATASGGAVEGLAGLLGMVNRVIYAFQEWLQKNSWARYLIIFGGALVTVIGVMALFRMITFRANAALLAFRVAAHQAGQAGIVATGGIRGLAGSLLGVGQAGGVAARGLKLFRAALVSTGIGAIAVGAGFLMEKLMGTSNGADSAALSMKEYNKIVKDAQGVSNGAGDSSENLADQLAGSGGGGGGGVAKAAEEAAEKVRTLVDYVTDLSGVMDRAYELRFGGEEAMDSVTSKWNKMNEEMAEYEQQVRSLTADRRLKEYFLKIANSYGDTLRAGELREDIAQIDDKLAKANEGASKKLKGNSQAAIENRREMRELSKGYQDYILALAKSGASQETIDAEIARLTREFEDQATQLGFNQNEIKKYTASFADIKTIVSQVPRDITVAFNADPAKQALNEFFAKVREDAAATGQGAGSDLSDGFDSGMGGLEVPELEVPEDTYDTGEQTGKEFVGGLAAGIGQWIGKAAFTVVEWFKKIPGMVGELFHPGKLFNGFQLAKNPFMEPILKWAMEAGGQGGKQTKKSMGDETKTLSWLDLFNLTTAAGIISGWGQAGKDSAKSYNENLGASADPDGEIKKKIPSGGGGGAGSIGAMGRLGDLGAAGFNLSVREKSNPDGSLRPGIENARTPISERLSSLGRFATGFYNTAMGLTANASGVLGQNASDARDNVKTRADSVGRSGGTSFNSGLGANASSGTILSGNLANAKEPAQISADSVGRAIGIALKGGIGLALDALFGGSNSKPRKIIKDITGFSEGGYTGAGHWLQPAGVVHRGEYVIPKKHVNQRTGLPDMGYVQSLQRGKSAPKSSYATGGHVSGGGFSGPIELGPTSLRLLSKQVAVDLKVDSKSLAAASSAGDRKLALRGSN